jgi:mRNA interferase MazF
VLRGELFRLPAPRARRGHEQMGQRFAILLQADELLALSTVVVAPTSTRAHAASFRPEVQIQGRQTRVLVEQLGAVDRSRLGESVGVLLRRDLEEVERAVRVVLDL